ncbi:hypothetical protein GGF32_004754 [Allomyces javanicus]|nr:hypothetical protein GGF32_004754 [Allomyces javanicus]
MGEEAVQYAFNTVGYMSVVTQHFRDPNVSDQDDVSPLSHRHVMQMVITLADLPIEIFEAARLQLIYKEEDLCPEEVWPV